MSERRSSKLSVQLFPFLAVLMCALGALILLLLVVTSRMRDQVRAERRQQVAAAAAAERVPEIKRPLPPARDHWQPATLPPDVKLQPSPISPTPIPSPDNSLRAKWLRTVTDLQAAAAAEESALEAVRNSTAAEERSLHEMQTRLVELQRDAAELDAQQAQAEVDREHDAANLAALELAVARETSELTERRQQRQAAASEYRILPYDGRSGTVRRPIYIECTETGLTFASEQITLTPAQLNGFAAAHNPLRAGADALIDYWTVKELKNSTGDTAGQPYVLLIVRPGGTIGYYVARRMLEALGQQFGYELVTDDLQLQWPPTDPGAVAACRAAIDAALQQRDNFVTRGYVPPGSLEPLSVSDGSGTFALEEVEQLRSNGRKVHVGGREFDRSARPGGGLSVLGPRGSPSASPNRADPGATPPTSGMQGFASGNNPAGGSTSPAMNDRNGASESQTAGRRGPATGNESASTESASVAAANAAADFSRSAARQPQPSGKGSAGRGGEVADNTPRPMQAADASGTGSQSSGARATPSPAAVLRDPGSLIGMERKVNIRVESQRVVIESEPAIEIPPGMSREELQAEFAAILQMHFESWGRPPRSFYWLPELRFTVLPGGHQHLKRLNDFTQGWEMSSTVNYALE